MGAWEGGLHGHTAGPHSSSFKATVCLWDNMLKPVLGQLGPLLGHDQWPAGPEEQPKVSSCTLSCCFPSLLPHVTLKRLALMESAGWAPEPLSFSSSSLPDAHPHLVPPKAHPNHRSSSVKSVSSAVPLQVLLVRHKLSPAQSPSCHSSPSS